MKKTSFAAPACFVLTEIIIQILGFMAYDIPDFCWGLADGILIIVPLLFGMIAGLICFIPLALSEIIWFIDLSVPGPLLHIASFVIIICLFGIAGRRLSRLNLINRIVLTTVLFEAGVWAEELLYYFLRGIFTDNRIYWNKASGTFLSWTNPVILAIGIAWIIINDRIEAKHT